MHKIITLLALLMLPTTCKLAEDTNASNLTSFRRDAKGNVTVAIGVFMNSYPSVVDGEFFPLELYDEEVAELEEGEFKGFAADVITGKHPFEGFKNPDAIEKAKARSPQDPYHLDGYYLKIMVVNDDIAPLPTEVYLSRGFFPHNFYCPAGQESVEIKADDNALGDPQGDNVLGSPNWTARAARTVNFCKTKEVNGPYAGRDFYYTRVSLFAQDTYHINELDDSLSINSVFENLDSQYHETISARASFINPRDGDRVFTESSTIVNLNYNATPAVLELQELLRQNNTAELEAIVSSTDKVQHYLHDNRNRAHDANWQVLLLAQRKWLAIRMILKKMGKQHDNKAEQLRIAILTSLEVADVRDMLPMTEKLADYSSAADYINALHKNPAATVADSAAQELFFSATSHQHFNRLIYHIAIASTTRQWLSSRKLYDWISSIHSISSACRQHCPEQEKTQVQNIIAKGQEKHAALQPFSREVVHDAWMTYVSAVNKIYPDATKAPAAFKKKYVVVGNTIDFNNSSQAYQTAYQRYSRRYDLVFAEPHGLLMGTEVFLQQMGDKRKPEDVHIVSRNGQLQYDWKMHPHVQYATVDTALAEMLEGIYRQAEQLHKLAQKIHRHEPNASQQIKLTSDFAEHYQILPIAKTLLIRPDYAYRMIEVFNQHTRFRPVEFLRNWGLIAVSIAATVAGLALSIPTLGASIALPALPAIMFATGGAAGLLSSAAQYQYGRVVQQRAENSLFADNFGTNFEEYHLARQEYLKARRALYFEAALTVFDAAEFVRFAYLFNKSTRQIKITTKFLGENTAKQYGDVFKHLKHCTAPYCRKFIQSLPILAAKKGEIQDLTAVLNQLQKNTSNLNEFKTALKNLWMERNVDGAFDKVIKTEFVDDIVRSRFLPFSNLRIPTSIRGVPFIPPKLNGISSARRAAMTQILDEKALESMRKNGTPEDMLKLFGSLVYGRRYKKKLIIFNRKDELPLKLLAKKLKLSDKELQELYVGKYKGKGDQVFVSPEAKKLKNIIDRTKSEKGKARQAAKRELQTELNKKRADLGNADGKISMKDTENYISLYQNEQRLTTLRADFAQMMGKVVVFKRKAIPRAGVTDTTMVPGLVSRPSSRLLGMKKDVIEQVANNSRWQKIFAANPEIKKELLGKLVEKEDKLVRDGGELQNMLENLNKIFNEAVIAYIKKITPVK